MATKATTAESSIGRRTIDAGRFARALTEPMSVAFDGPGIATVEHGEQRVTELGVRVARFARNAGCAHSVRGCAGPTVVGHVDYPASSASTLCECRA